MRMFTVALIGPDGAGKTTLARRLEGELPLPARYLYMGVSADSSSALLPTRRVLRALKRRLGATPDTAGPPDSTAPDAPPRSYPRRVLASIRALVRVANLLGDEWYRQLIVWREVRRGVVVIFDRHYFADFFHYDVDARRRRRLDRRIHGFVLARIYPRPDLVVYLDAPADVLLARKGEGTLDVLERRRREYLELDRVIDRFAVVDAARPADDVVGDLVSLVTAYAAERGVLGPKAP